MPKSQLRWLQNATDACQIPLPHGGTVFNMIVKVFQFHGCIIAKSNFFRVGKESMVLKQGKK